MRNILSALLAVVLLAVVVGCCPCRKGKNNKPLASTEWRLMRMMGADVDVADNQFVFQFYADGRFSGVGACNHLMGDYTISDTGAISFGELAGTRMMCPRVELETKFSEIISRATHYEIDGDMLLLFSNGELQAIFKAK